MQNIHYSWYLYLCLSICLFIYLSIHHETEEDKVRVAIKENQMLGF